MSVAASLSPSRTRFPRTRSRSSAWLVAGLMLFSALPLSFGILRLLQLTGISDAMPPASASAVPLVSHIVGALAYSLLGAIQFSPAIRRRWPAWHRVAGRLALVGAALVVFSALWLTAAYATPSFGGLVLAGFRVAYAPRSCPSHQGRHGRQLADYPEAARRAPGRTALPPTEHACLVFGYCKRLAMALGLVADRP